MMDGQKAGMIFGSLGGIVGGLLWIVILGIIAKSAVITAAPLILGAVCFFMVAVLYKKYPRNYMAINGAVFVFIAVTNLIFINLLKDKLPDRIGTMSTGKESFQLSQLNILMAVFFLIGIFLIIKETLRKK